MGDAASVPLPAQCNCCHRLAAEVVRRSGQLSLHHRACYLRGKRPGSLFVDWRTWKPTIGWWWSTFSKASPSLAAAHELVQSFIHMVRTRGAAMFDEWLAQAASSGIGELERFASALVRDYDAVLAALSLPYSNGPVEGHVNRLKFLKRMGYGRAKLDVLRQRVLA